MNRRPLEPLDAEEAALAEQLARLGPHGEPSPRLDARILAAAHDAVSEPLRPRQRSRWPLGLGVAASALLAVGIAWQLRPVDHSPLDREFASADAAAAADTGAAAQATETGPAEDALRTVVPPPAPLQSRSEVVAQDDTLPANAAPSAVYNPPNAVAAQPKVAAAKRAPRTAQPHRAAEAPPLDTSSTLDSIAVDISAPQHRNTATTHLPPPPPPPPPAAVASTERQTRVLGGVVADPETYAEIAAQREQARAEHARNAAVSAERAERTDVRARRASEASSDMQSAIQQAPASAAPASPTDGSSPEFARSTASAPTVRNGNTSVPLLSPGVTRNSLKRTDLQLPVIEDSKLDADDWLERIRLRRDLGDRASAVESLLRFRQAHPFQKTPEDLQELLAE